MMLFFDFNEEACLLQEQKLVVFSHDCDLSNTLTI